LLDYEKDKKKKKNIQIQVIFQQNKKKKVMPTYSSDKAEEQPHRSKKRNGANT